MQEHSKLTVLVVDPSAGMRASVQNMLAQSNITKVEFAVSAGTAIRQLSRKSYDIILCEYDLGAGQDDGQDGQQLLEDLRHHRLIGLWTIFIMITAEGVYGKVVSAAELAPTDYLLTPFNAETLGVRIARALERRAAFLPTYQLIGQGNLRAAVRSCTQSEAANPRYAAEFARLRADLHMTLGELAEAEGLYKAVLAIRPFGWAQLGLARALHGQKHHEQAREVLQRVLDDNPRLMAAYDLMAQWLAAEGRHADAQRVLEEAIAVSPHMVRRLRTLGGIAAEAGDKAAAEKTFRQVVARSRYSEFRDPEDHVNLVRAQVECGDAAGATATIRDLERSLRGNPNADACVALSTAMVHDAAGARPAATEALRQAAHAARDATSLSPQLRISLAQGCIAHQLDNEASQVMLDAVANTTSGISVAQAMDVFSKAGRDDLAESISTSLKRRVAQLLNEAAEKTAMGDLKGAVQTLADAQHKAPGSLHVMSALAEAIIRQVSELGWDHPMGELCGRQLAELRQREPGHPKLAALQDGYNAARRRYGIAG